MSVGGFPSIVDDDPNWYGWLIPRKAKWQNKCKTHIASEIQWLPWWFPQLYIIQIRYRMGEQHPPCFPHLMWTPGVTHIVYFNYCKLMKCDAIGKFSLAQPKLTPRSLPTSKATQAAEIMPVEQHQPSPSPWLWAPSWEEDPECKGQDWWPLA